jgi:hypothetical protein
MEVYFLKLREQIMFQYRSKENKRTARHTKLALFVMK